MSRNLVIIEVSQKQAFIFASNKLKDNIYNSEVIAYVTSDEYFKKVCNDDSIYNTKDNMVYAGGGHTICEFENLHKAQNFVSKITENIIKEYPKISIFAKVMEYDENKNPGENLKALTQGLEKKKSVRRASFHQGTFGIEKINPNTLEPLYKNELKDKDIDAVRSSQTGAARINDYIESKGYIQTNKLENLCIGDDNFIAIIHIDGNGMGSRVSNIYDKYKTLDWNDFKTKIREFSISIDDDFKKAYLKMIDGVTEAIEKGSIDIKNLQEDTKAHKLCFPIRRIITSGDDICFITDGKIGLECANMFVKALRQLKNKVDEESYEACAGICLVHKKYPFFKAYELAEGLCSNAKRYCASLDKSENGKRISAIDWHIEFGEVEDSIDVIRNMYLTADNKHLEMRPYIIGYAGIEIPDQEKCRSYTSFKSIIEDIQDPTDNYARSKIKGLRNELKKSEEEAVYYVKFNKIQDLTMNSIYGKYKELNIPQIGSGGELDKSLFIKMNDQKEHCILFDEIELMDNYISL